MSRVLDFFTDLVARTSATEIAMLCGLAAVMVAGLIVPRLVGSRSRRAFTDRDAEWQRLQNM